MDHGTVDEIAALFWEQAERRSRGYPDQHEAMPDAETMALDFLTQYPGLWRGHNLDPQRLAEAIAEQMPEEPDDHVNARLQPDGVGRPL
jgi:hypothetical protein